MIVADASLVVGALADTGPIGDWATATLEPGAVAAHLLPAEVSNALRRRGWTPALPMSTLLGGLPIVYEPFEPYADRIWELRDHVAPYDAWYVAIAEVHDLPLATTDRHLAGAPGLRCELLLPPE